MTASLHEKSILGARPRAPVSHVLPGEEDALSDVTWLSRQNPFEQAVIRQQVKFKREGLRITENGRFSKQPNHSYPHILPEGHTRQAFFSGIVDAILAYLDEANIQPHSELLNLKSSQAAGLNFLFPLRSNLDLATEVLTRAKIVPPGCRVTAIEFEYTGQDEGKKERGCTEWLGEPRGGKRGQNRTSIDAAIFWSHEGRARATLVEWKYTERSFGSCSAFDKAKKDAKTRCLGPDFEKHCILTDGRRNHERLYWERLEMAGISRAKLECVAGCPFRGPFYQLMRQFLIAQYMRQAKIVDFVDVVAIHFKGNDSLRALPPELAPLSDNPKTTVVAAWNKSLDDGTPPMREVAAEDLLDAYNASSKPTDPNWRKYILDRYGL